MTLEYAYQDWCLAQLAKSLGKTGMPPCSKRALQLCPNLGSAAGWMRPRRSMAHGMSL